MYRIPDNSVIDNSVKASDGKITGGKKKPMCKQSFFSRKTIKHARWIVITLLLFTLAAVAGGLGYADEEEKRRVDISLSIFPRVVAVDNNFREKLNSDNMVKLLVLYIENKARAEKLAERMASDDRSIGGMSVTASVLSLENALIGSKEIQPTAIFISERLNDKELKRIMAYAESKNRIVFSPFSGDVERGATVGISVTSRVKPYFNLPVLKRSNVVINALLLKMSKQYE